MDTNLVCISLITIEIESKVYIHTASDAKTLPCGSLWP